METIHTRIWQEEAEPDNAFAALSCHCHSYDSAAMARALGAESYTIRSPEDLSRLDIASMCARKGPPCPAYLLTRMNFRR